MKEETVADSMFWSLMYNCHEEEVEELAEALESSGGPFHLQAPYEYDSMMQALWMILVQLFGEYGSSPRTGWIEDAKGCAKFLRDHVNHTWGWNG